MSEAYRIAVTDGTGTHVPDRHRKDGGEAIADFKRKQKELARFSCIPRDLVRFVKRNRTIEGDEAYNSALHWLMNLHPFGHGWTSDWTEASAIEVIRSRSESGNSVLRTDYIEV